MHDKRAPLIYRFAACVLGIFFKIIYKCEVRGAQNIPLIGRTILASNHVSAVDPMILGCFSPRQVHFMAKDTLFKNKIASYFIRKVGAFPVVRGTGGDDALTKAYEILDEEKVVGIFIEGTRSKDGQLLKPKTGASLVAYKTKSTVVPISIIGKGGTLPQKFNKTMINIGKPISFEELGMDADSSMHCRRAAKVIMAEIAKLREEAIQLMGE